MTSILAAGEVIDNAKNSIDLWYAFIIGLPALVAAVATLYGQRKAKANWAKHRENTATIINQVKNSHSENLRDEITRGFREVRGDILTLHEDHQLLRQELRLERVERIEGDRARGDL